MLTRFRLAFGAAFIVFGTSVFPGLAVETQSHAGGNDPLLAKLGEELFFDTALSMNETQSCATCHDPDHAFTDPRDGLAGKAVSLGDDGKSHGDRNTPTLAYMALSPEFHQAKSGEYKGGQFWDGRARNLADQAGQPMLNPVEMGMPDRETIVERVRAKSSYTDGFAAVFGADALADGERGFEQITLALQAYQQTPEFMPFDSKFDRYLRGEEKLTKQEEFGYTVYLTWNCRLCHQEHAQGVNDRETFTNFEYRNIGIPVNPAARKASGMATDFLDEGLAGQPGMNDPKQRGKFKVPTLRNVAVTGPYMHNGVFKELRTAVVFYNKYTTNAVKWQIDPETGEHWAEPEVPENLAMKELRSGLTVSDERVDALVAFLETLTDKKYEPLLEEVRAERATKKLAEGD